MEWESKSGSKIRLLKKSAQSPFSLKQDYYNWKTGVPSEERGGSEGSFGCL